MIYGDFLNKISSRLQLALDAEIDIYHNYEFGSEFEIALCRTIRRALPQKFGICRGYVVDLDGYKAGDDIIIYDRIKFPTLRGLAEEDYSRKENVPIEAVYAYLEAKHTLSLDSDAGEKSGIIHAANQVQKVKELCYKRAKVPIPKSELGYMQWKFESNNISSIIGLDRLNPVFGAVIARKVSVKGRELTDTDYIQDLLRSLAPKEDNTPDLIIAGSNNVLVPLKPDINGPLFFQSPFASQIANPLQSVKVDKISFGIGLALLLYALDLIELGNMPWYDIIGDGLGFRKQGFLLPQQRSGSDTDNSKTPTE